MKFIQDKLNDVGPVNFAFYVHDDSSGKDSLTQLKVGSTKVVADTGACRVSYHFTTGTNGQVGSDDSFFLKQVADIAVMTMEQGLKEESIEMGSGSSKSFKVEPPVFSLKVHMIGRGHHYFVFYDEALANRVAKAMVHAVELCGGGGKPEPF